MKKKLTNKPVIIILMLGMLLVGCSPNNNEQAKGENKSEKYPTKPITLIVSLAAGGASDLMARAMEKVAVQHLGEPIVVVNKPGGGQTIGWNELADSKPDGYTLGVVTSSLTLQPLYGETKHNYPEALEPIAQASTLKVVLAVLADSPWKNLDDFIAHAKQKPSDITYAHTGLGSITHLAGETFSRAANVKLEQVPFQGGSQALTAFLGGHVDAIFVNTVEVQEHVKAGKVIVLGVADEKRLTDPLFKDVPTFKEKGVDAVASAWTGIAAPLGLPEDIKKKLAEGFKNIISDESFIKSANDLNMVIEYLGPKEFGDMWKSESEFYKVLVKETGIAEKIAAQKK